MSEQHDDLRRLAEAAMGAWGMQGHTNSPERIIALLDERDALEREVCACRAALEEVGYTGSLPEGVYDRLERERDAFARALIECDATPHDDPYTIALRDALARARELAATKETP